MFLLLLAGLGLLLAAAVLGQLWSWPIWGPAARFLAENPAIVVGLLGALLLATAVVARRRPRGNASHRGEVTWRPPWPLSDWTIAAVVVGVAGVGVWALRWMLGVADQVPIDTGAGNTHALRIEAIKYGLGTIAAGGAAAALLLAVRRQRHAEHTQARAEEDASHRRVTELYTKAVEQLGHDEAAVRLGGLYALERVAQDNADQRQTIVNVLCAYLRMPYALPTHREPDQAAEPAEPVNGSSASTEPSMATGPVRDPRQELQVRLTAQRILTRHLGTSEHEMIHWKDIDLDLTGAILVNWSLILGRIRSANFIGATFAGSARFTETVFAYALFNEAIFTEVASFDQVHFIGTAQFDMATFSGRADFSMAAFQRDAWFTRTTFASAASFDSARFVRNAQFGAATFANTARFDDASFMDTAAFDGVTFTGTARFLETNFARDAPFDKATFGGTASFMRATFKGGGPSFRDAKAKVPRPRSDCWPPGWQMKAHGQNSEFGSFVYVEVSAVPDGDGHASASLPAERLRCPPPP